MSETILKYRIYCNTDDRWEHQWGTTPITHCPVDPLHDINPDSVADVDEISEQTLVLKTKTAGSGRYQQLSVGFDAASNAVTSYVFSFPYPISIQSASFYAGQENATDIVSVLSLNDTPIGLVTSASQKWIHADMETISRVFIGMEVSISDQTNTTAYSRITSIETNRFELETPVAFDFLPAAVIRSRVYYIKDVELSGPGWYAAGQNTLQSVFLPSNFPITIRYDNKSGVAKRFVVQLEINY